MSESAGKIRDVSKLLEGVPNLGIFQGDFHNPNVYLTDLDGIVECRGYFLVHEYKKIFTELNQGQSIMQDELIKKGFTIINIWHRGSCWDMNFVRAEIRIPLMLSSTGSTEWVLNEDVLLKIKQFHKWWVKKVKTIIESDKQAGQL